MKENIREIAFGITFSYCLVLLFFLAKSLELSTLYKSAFMYVMATISPFMMLNESLGYMLPVLVGAAMCYLLMTKVPLLYRRYALCAFILCWQIFGVFSLNYITGGA